MSAVEYLEKKLLELFGDHLPFELLDEAKEMEKQQIIEAFIEGDGSDCTQEENPRLYAEEYYNKTYKK